MSTQNPTKLSREEEEGFTLIEIIISLVVFMVAVMGMVALQGASIHAASKSRRHTAAVSIARYINAELKSEFAGWDKTQTSADFPADTFPLLTSIFRNGGSGPGNWTQLGGSVTGAGDFRLDEFLGHNGLTNNNGASRFCVNYRVDPLEILPGDQDTETAEPWERSVWQVRVRVSWTKEGAFLTNGTTWNTCDPTTVETRILTDFSDDVVELLATASRELAR